LGAGSGAWGDYDNDGKPDILLTGLDSEAKPMSVVYHNDGGGAFSDALAGLTDTFEGNGAWGDYDNDGDLDILLTGYTEYPDVGTILYRNDGGTPNTRPTAPTGLTATTAAGITTFSWLPSTDVETPAAGLSYNLRVGTVPAGHQGMS